MRRICAWCVNAGRSLEEASLGDDIEPLDNPVITHGVCPEHLEGLYEELKREFPNFKPKHEVA